MKTLRIFLVVVLAANGAATLSAHHSLTETYETGKTVSLAGVIAKVDLINPHVKVDLTATDGAGNATTWTIELAPPNVLRRKFDLQLLKMGQPVTIESWLRKDGKREANGRTLVTADGKRFDVGDGGNWITVPSR